MPKSDKVLIKVGKTSTLRLRNIDTYRAITINELESLYREHSSDIKLIVVESITQEEYNNLCKFIRSIKSEVRTVFYCSTSDEITSGAADELDLDIFSDSADFYGAMKSHIGRTINPDLYEQAAENKNNYSFDEDDVFGSDDFGQSLSEAAQLVAKSSNESVTEQVVELPDIMSKADISDEFTDDDLGIAVPKINLPNASVETGNPDKFKTTEASGTSGASETLETPETSGIVSSEEVNKLNNKIRELQDKLNSKETELAEALAKANNIESSIAESNKRVEEAIGKINDLNSIIAVLKSEKLLLQQELTKVETLEIIEDPVTVEEYNRVKLELSQIESGESASRQELDAVKAGKAELEEIKLKLEEQIAELEITIKDHEETIRNSQNLIDEANNRATALEEALETIRHDNTTELKLQEALNSLSDSNRKLAENQYHLSELDYKVKIGAVNRELLMTMLYSAVDKVTRYEQVIGGQKSDIISLRDERDRLSASLGELQAARDLFVQNNQVQLDQLTSENMQLRSQVDILRNQLIAKEAQYNSVIQTGAGGPVDNTKITILEGQIRTYRAELDKARDELAKKESALLQANENNERISNENRVMKQKVGAMASGLTGAGVKIVDRIRASGRGLVIPVIGSGSYGITTAAYSLANHLALSSRVVFIDFDMISAKSDSWFGLPILQDVPGIPPNNKRSTGLGVFFDKGFEYFSENYDRLILRKFKFKSGAIDYIGGLYYKIDPLKLSSANLTGLITLCKNNYDYVIIDCGRLGANDLNDQLIAAITEASYKTVVVTPGEFIEVRNFRNLLQECNINVTKVAWMLNMCRTTKVNDKMKGLLAATKYSVIPFISDLYELTDNGYKKKHFIQDRTSRDKFSYFVNTCIFNK